VLAARPPPRPTLFPYTTLFRSVGECSSHRLRLDIQPDRAPWIGIRHRGLEHDGGLIGEPAHRNGCRSVAFQLLQGPRGRWRIGRSEEHTSELQSLTNIVCRLLL